MCHGTPASDPVYFLEQVDVLGSHLAKVAYVEAHAASVERSLIICGHSHKPRTYAISGGRLVVNPGGVGLQAYDDDQPYFHTIENGSPHARYAICEHSGSGWNIWQRCITYPYLTAAAQTGPNG